MNLIKFDTSGDTLWLNSDGESHRLNGPAVELTNGNKEWYMSGDRHRLNGPAIEWLNGFKSWYVNNKRHRLDGPAIEWLNGFWYIDDKRHRLDGPAVECIDGRKQWWIEDIQYTKSRFIQEVVKHDQ